MTLDDLHALLDFHYWARDRALDAAAKLTPWADWVWYQLWHGTFPTQALSTDEFRDVDSIRRAWTDLESKARAFVAQGGPDAHRVIRYTRPDGSAAAFPFAHMIQHLVNHGTYHRGQLTMLLRQLGAEPPETTDLIQYYRKHSTAV